ncbi:multiple epidermal growth factor-like domains protein 11 [Pecten maximus]|uniref:multiple epidermal growth factor-like domains protein 11 n=1 Tax=Pecten maximus TaxID=6579 RepID=UPI001458A639|nr:multiple epidermal growth factor-like domains protein 11 [Pecten maximus]
MKLSMILVLFLHISTTVSLNVRLVDGPTQNQGRVEIYNNGQWGTVCDDGFETDEAKAVCNELGYRYGTAFERSYFGNGSGEIFVDNLDCSDRSTGPNTLRLGGILCHFNGWGDHNCNHREDASVVCEVCAQGTFGQSCSSRCHCRSSECDPVSGNCTHQPSGCLAGWRGARCDQACEEGTFGPSCSKNCHCEIPGCDGATGLCTGGICLPGWRGTSCANGCGQETFGQSCSSRCHCKISGCNPITGVCTNQSAGCSDGWTGDRCDQACGYQTFGDSCSNICHCRSSGCNSVSGLCTSPGDCLEGWTGDRCDQACGNGTFGNSCSFKCHCRFPGCDPVTGICTNQGEGCEVGWTGNSCSQVCGLGLFGTNCLEMCHCQVPGCDPVTGVCNTGECQSGWKGQSCNITFKMESQVNSPEPRRNSFVIAVAFLSVLLAASIAINIGLYITRRRSASEDDKDPCISNIPHSPLESVMMPQSDNEANGVSSIVRYGRGYGNQEISA